MPGTCELRCDTVIQSSSSIKYIVNFKPYYKISFTDKKQKDIDKKAWLVHQLYQFQSIYDSNKDLSKYICPRNIYENKTMT